MSRRDYQPGERVPGTIYDVVRVIGVGGMGTVYDVEDTTIGKRYVLKTLHPQLGAREDLARRMQNEARTLARLNHPNIVEVFTAGVTGDVLRLPFYVMERLNGQSLRVVLEKKGQLELPHAYHIGIDLLDALDHAHDKGVIHRDVKPDNIFLHRTAGGVTVTKLLDFGIMSLLDRQSRDTAGRFVGTLRYAAPEQLGGERPSPQTDIYAVALVLYEMVAGRGPFDDEGDPHAVAAAHVHKVPPPLSRFASVPPGLDALVMAALAKRPDARPRDAFSFAASLRNIKRAAGGGAAREATEDRVTAAALGGAAAPKAPFVNVRQASPDGPVVISPAPCASPPLANDGGSPGGFSTALPRSTLAGLAPPGVCPLSDGGADPNASPTVTTPDPVDRMAVTYSLAPDVPRAPRHGTDPMSVAGPIAPTLPGEESSAVADGPLGWRGGGSGRPPSGPGATPFDWPDERPLVRSDDPQVRPLSLSVASSARSGPGLRIAAFGLALAAAASILLLALRHRIAAQGAGSAATPALPTSASVVPPPAAVLHSAPVPEGPAGSDPLPASDIPALSNETSATAPRPTSLLPSKRPGRGKASHRPPPSPPHPSPIASGANAVVPPEPPLGLAAPQPVPLGACPPTTPAVPSAIAPASAPTPAPGPDRPGPGF